MPDLLILEDAPKSLRINILKRKSFQELGARLHQVIMAGGYGTRRFISEKKLYGAIRTEKPQAVVIHEFAGKLRRRISAKYPFIPVIVYGEFTKEKKMNRLMRAGAARCLKAPFEKERVIPAIKEVLWRGLAKEELWNDQMAISSSESGRKFAGNVLTTVISLAIVVGLITTFKDRIFTVHNTLYTRTYSTLYTNPTGITLYGDALWVCDWKTQNIYKHGLDDNFTLKRVNSFPEKRFSGITFGAGYMWTTDPWEKKLYRHRIDGRLEITGSYVTPGPNPMGIDYDGKYFWMCDNSKAKIYKIQIKDGLEVVDSYNAPDSSPVGIFCDGYYVWTADSKSNRLYRHRKDDGLTVDTVFVPPDYMNLASIDGDDEYIWICSEKESKIYRYPRKLLEPVE